MQQPLGFKSLIIHQLDVIKTHLSLQGKQIEFDYTQKLNDIDLILFNKFTFSKHKILKSMCDCIKTKNVMVDLQKLAELTIDYIKGERKTFNNYLLKNIYDYIIRMLQIFGLEFAALFQHENDAGS